MSVKTREIQIRINWCKHGVSSFYSWKKKEKESENVYIYFFFFCQMKEVSWMSDRGMIRNERLNRSERVFEKENEIFIKKINLRWKENFSSSSLTIPFLE